VEETDPWEAYSRPAGHEIPRHLWKPKVRHWLCSVVWIFLRKTWSLEAGWMTEIFLYFDRNLKFLRTTRCIHGQCCGTTRHRHHKRCYCGREMNQIMGGGGWWRWMMVPYERGGVWAMVPLRRLQPHRCPPASPCSRLAARDENFDFILCFLMLCLPACVPGSVFSSSLSFVSWYQINVHIINENDDDDNDDVCNSNNKSYIRR
jgi:hypothetical protein